MNDSTRRKQPLHTLFAGSDRNMKIGMICALLVVLIGAIGILTDSSGDPAPSVLPPAATLDQDDTITNGEANDSGSVEGADDRSNDSDASGDDEPAQQVSDLPPILASSLPDEALDTLELIASNGPYPFSKDDSTFQNREGFLPQRDQGHYREYTVITPGEGDRGARRIVAGDDGELYYTSDHYASFSEIVTR